MILVLKRSILVISICAGKFKDPPSATGCKLTAERISKSYRATLLRFVFSNNLLIANVSGPAGLKMFGTEWWGIQPCTEAFKIFSHSPGEARLPSAISKPWSHAFI